jgi:hypothetical protein
LLLVAPATAISAPSFEVALRGGVNVGLIQVDSRWAGPATDIVSSATELEAGARLLDGQLSVLAKAFLGFGTYKDQDLGPMPFRILRFGAEVLGRPVVGRIVEPWIGFAIGIENYNGAPWWSLLVEPAAGCDFKVWRLRLGPYVAFPLRYDFRYEATVLWSMDAGIRVALVVP